MGYRKTVFANDEIYHTYNRGVEKRPIFMNKRDYIRFVEIINYYRFANCPIRFSHFNRLRHDEKEKILNGLNESPETLVDVLSFCLMPNHIHLLLKQLEEHGVVKFMAKITNAYSHYFNTKYERAGHLFQGNFGAVRMESDEQLVHVSRYIHLNPVTSYLIEFEDLEKYEWSSYPEYLDLKPGFCNTKQVMSYFKNVESYKKFVANQVNYARELGNIKHLTLET